MPDFSLDQEGFIFFCLGLLFACWAVFDTQRFIRLLSYNRKKTFTRSQVMVIKVPGIIVILSLAPVILYNLLVKLGRR